MILLVGFFVVVAAVLAKHRTIGLPAVRDVHLIAAAMVLQVLVINVFEHVIAHDVASAVHLGTYGLGAVFLVRNVRVPGFAILAAGGASNLVAIAANGGVMPAHPAALRLAGIAPDAASYANSTAVPGARLWWFGDVFAIPSALPLANVFSVGDVLLLVGAYLVFDRAARAESEQTEAVVAASGEPGRLDGSLQSMTVASVVGLVRRSASLGASKDRALLRVFTRALDVDASVSTTLVPVRVDDHHVIVYGSYGRPLATWRRRTEGQAPASLVRWIG